MAESGVVDVRIMGSFKLAPPASRTQTETKGSSLKRAARVKPAVPPPRKQVKLSIFMRNIDWSTSQRLTNHNVIESFLCHIFDHSRHRYSRSSERVREVSELLELWHNMTRFYKAPESASAIASPSTGIMAVVGAAPSRNRYSPS